MPGGDSGQPTLGREPGAGGGGRARTTEPAPLRLGGLREHSGLLTPALGSVWMTCAGLCSVACGLHFYLGLEILNLWLELDLTQKDLCSARKGPAPGETVHCPPVAGTWAWEPPRCPEFAKGWRSHIVGGSVLCLKTLQLPSFKLGRLINLHHHRFLELVDA